MNLMEHRMNETTDLNDRRNLLRGPAFDALVALVVAEAEYVTAIDAEQREAA